MGKALRINVHPRAITLAGILERGEREFKDLHPRDKEILLRTDANLDGLVDPEQLAKYQLRKEIEQTDSKTKTAALKAKMAVKHD